MLTRAQLEHVCLLYQDAKQCRYLKDDITYNAVIWVCCKHNSALKKEADYFAEEAIKEFKAQGSDPNSGDIPLGDNCSGYPILKYLKQGYDVD